MSAGRGFAALAVIAAGMLAAGLLISRAARTLHNDGLFNSTAPSLLHPGPAAAPTHHARHGRTPRHAPVTRLRRAPRHGRPMGRPTAAPVKPIRQRRVKRSGGLLGLGELKVLLVAALEIAAGVALLAMLGAVLVLRRVRRRSRRRYELYELHLSTHDQAKPQDLEDMVESIANIIRAFPAERVRDGQPYVALELISGQSEGGTEWSVNVRCEPSSVRALDAAISATYPDVRIGRQHSDPSRPRNGVLRVPGCVMRFRKRRSFVYPLLAAGEELASPPLEQIARAQVELGEPSIVRFQLTPTAAFFEDSARRAFRRHERRLARRDSSTPRPAGLSSTLDRSEMQNAGRAQNRSLFWLETVIAADTTHACKTIAAAVQSRRGENRLHRRIMIVRQRLYRRRFPLALGPLIPSMRCLVSAAEVAHLLELPTARMKGVPVRRTALPRIPAPPNILRAASGRLDPRLDPVLRAENAQVGIAPVDRKYGVLLTGGQGSGKCVGPDDLVLLGGRLTRAEDAWERYVTSAVFDGEGWWSEPLEQPLTCALNAQGRVVAAPVARVYRQRISEPVRKVRLSDGSELMLTRRHRLRGPDDWTADLREGSVVCVPRRVEWPGTQVDLELAELLAWQIAEGCETTNGKRRPKGSSCVSITQSDVTTLSHLRDLAQKVGQRYGLKVGDIAIHLRLRVAVLRIESADWRDFLVARGYGWGRVSAEKALPDFIMQGDIETSRVVLRALYDAEGWADGKNGRVELTSASRLLAEQIRMLLRRFGMLVTLRLKRGLATNGSRIERDYWRVVISGESARSFLAEIGFSYQYKERRLRRATSGVEGNSNREGVYAQDLLQELRALDVPMRQVSPRSRNYLHTLRASHPIALEIAENIRSVATRLDAGRHALAGARGSAAMASRSAALARIDPDKLREMADQLDRRVEQEVVYLTVDRIEEIDYDGWVYDFEVPDHHNYVAGGMLVHNSAALLALYLNDCKDPNAAPIVVDPKSELSRLCLKFTRPDGGKTVWYLDLGHPAFGMNPLRLSGDRPLPVEAGAIADNIVAALLDINANQIYQSSRRYLYHAVIGAIALAHRQDRRAKFEDVYNLLLPTKTEIRAAVAEACSDEPDLDQTAEFFAYELPHELQLAGSATAQRLDAPRNKVSLLLQVPSLRRWFSHPTDIPLREIIDARDVLLIDANMGAIGEENSKACMHFLLRLLHTQMQRQVHLPETDRPRVPLLIDEAHYVMGAENVIDQFATHRRAGLEPACAIQYFSQLGSGSEHAEKIRKGVLNLLQSRLLFRLGDADDAEQATRIAMAVYSTMIHDDPDSRARLRVTPEQLLNFPNYHCLASWIADGTRAPCFIGQTYPWATDTTDAWAEDHVAQQTARVAPYPVRVDSTLDRTSADVTDPDTPSTKPPKPSRPAERDSRQPGGKREVQVDYEPPPEPPRLDDSPVRRVVGRRVPGPAPAEHDGPAPDSLRELAFLDRINEIGPADQLDGAANLPRLYNEDFAILSLLDRAGLAPRSLIGRAVLPDRAPRTVAHRLTKLYRHGLIAQHTTGLAGHARSDGTPPLLYSLTRRGLEVAQTREPPAISRKREWRAIEQHNAGRLAHDLHSLAWAIELHRIAGKLATDHWRTARYATGRHPVPQAGSGRDRHAITVNEIPLPDKQAIIDLQLQKFAEIHPDVSLELRIDTLTLTFDLLVELDLTSRPSYNQDKLLAYDAFLCGWSLAHPRYRAQGTRPVVVFVCRDPHAALALAREADQALTGRIGIMGTPAEHWYYPGRDHIFFAVERDIHHGNLAALALPPRPPGLRERLTGDSALELSQVLLLPDKLLNQ